MAAAPSDAAPPPGLPQIDMVALRKSITLPSWYLVQPQVPWRAILLTLP